MSDLPTLYRRCPEDRMHDTPRHMRTAPMCSVCMNTGYVKVERCVHGMIDPHNIYLSEHAWIMGEPDERCPGSPTLQEEEEA